MRIRRNFLKKIAALFVTPVAIPAVAHSIGKHEVASKIKIRFAIASDGHYGQENTPYEMYYPNIVKWLNYENKEHGLDLAFFNGDLIHDNPEYLPKVKEYLDKLEMPYYVGRGNHDRISEQGWRDLWGYATNHVFSYEDSTFIIVDTSNEAGDYLCANVSWVKEQLQNNAHKANIFLFMHISQNDWTRFGVKCEELLEVITMTANVKAIFHGHDHQEDDRKELNGKPFLFSGHFGGSWGVEYKGFRICEITKKNKLLTYMVNPIANARINYKTA